jgi:protein-disulfide isomerase
LRTSSRGPFFYWKLTANPTTLVTFTALFSVNSLSDGCWPVQRWKLQLVRELDMMEKKRFRLVGLIILLVDVGIILGVKATKGFPTSFEVESYKIRGNPDAPFYLLEFSDFTCPYCARLDPILRDLLEKNKDMKLVFKVFPLSSHGEIATTAAVASECAGEQGKYWVFHDRLFDNPMDWYASPKKKFTEYATEFGMDAKSFAQCVDTQKTLPVVQRNIAEGRRYFVNATPTLIFNGTRILQVQDFDEFKIAIEDALHQARGSK